MQKRPLPEEARRGEAVRKACRMLEVCDVRLLPPDPEAVVRELDYALRSLSSIAEELRENPDRFIRRTVGEEAFTLSFGREEYLIVYDDTIRSPERIRFSIFHELGHLLMRHFESWDLMEMTEDQARVLEEEANTFARNFLCPPPVADLIRGDGEDPKWAALFGLSRQAWQVRRRTLAVDRRYIDQRTADELRIRFRDYMFGRRCRDCGAVFTDETRQDRCPRCGSRFLRWNPGMEDAAQAAARKHVAGATAEDLRPRVGDRKELDLTAYWEQLRRERRD